MQSIQQDQREGIFAPAHAMIGVSADQAAEPPFHGAEEGNAAGEHAGHVSAERKSRGKDKGKQQCTLRPRDQGHSSRPC